ncbi:Phosphoenolpyruvate/pyruvate domain-containing protein [Aspergillus heteromorphus CBS 117.55]|uniref:Phosphoenolpyruvate/pyruvate domain-containing protein n=1 Tax=Aspergillus heteromorphus CBS 117.55 TaxID=1448321 RepID=A0A317VRB3_9EURO|nr:Phosphoenolpyruvate/pyruvate domain-containing protein [Aspergillus heteromorphus CBS 117.55]PWY75438.1 Phosphoenolpyruvate/pyruvate domain-containing protein [Aspergillus heteromorphus CBS 117.55]
MPFTTAVRETFQSSSPALGFWLTLPSAGLVKTILHGPSGLDSRFTWVLVDAEHGLITDRDYYELCNAIGSEGASPIVRVPFAEEWMIKRALDAGAHGIVTPMCHSAADATKIVRASKYPPLGTRGYGPMFAPHAFPGVAAGEEYDEGSQHAVTVIVQIESRAGVENVEEIAAVEGIDVLFIGPFDLSKNMGVVRGGQEHEAAIQRVLKATHDAGKKAAIFCTDGNDAKERIRQGFDMVSVNTDVGVIRNGMLGELRVAVGGSAKGASSGGGY